ncbi:hypothetical protein DPMN_076134 [Dreissena polymorpha]|uniref:Uncharacterized protein n=1 Tax=Dreissena polymorpha TaxID=45954 RepID=A0A9D3YJJ4_DREPO|nr:hypothetical protein DPMN_076134 [Dreissena polymorpha]
MLCSAGQQQSGASVASLQCRIALSVAPDACLAQTLKSGLDPGHAPALSPCHTGVGLLRWPVLSPVLPGPSSQILPLPSFRTIGCGAGVRHAETNNRF